MMKVKIKDIEKIENGLYGVFVTDNDKELVYPFLNKLPEIEISKESKEIFDEELCSISCSHSVESAG